MQGKFVLLCFWLAATTVWAEEPRAVQPGAGVRAPIAITAPEAKYPPSARDQHLNGLCSVSAIVDVKGLPTDIHVIRCSDTVFAGNSAEAVSRYRFKPGTLLDGTVVAVKISVLVNFRVIAGRAIQVAVSYSLRTPPGAVAALPDAQGVYPLTGAVEMPNLTEFVDEGYGMRAMFLPGKGTCDVVLVIDAEGKPEDPDIKNCETTALGEQARKSLLDSHFRAGRFEGAAVPVRTMVHLEFGGFSAE